MNLAVSPVIVREVTARAADSVDVSFSVDVIVKSNVMGCSPATHLLIQTAPTLLIYLRF
jgi:hypothetical protein